MSNDTHVYCNLRLMEPEDIDEVMQIERASYEFPWSEGIFKDCLRAGYCCMVVSIEENVVGYGIMMQGADEAHLLNLCLSEVSRGNGFARALLADLCESARAQGAREMYLEVRPSNTVAIGLYSSLGFNEVGRRPNYYDAGSGREDALILARTL
ncbi:MAG: ribosomal protein S18-alanine N-acetyltransferase [Granulosicoccus sp.]|nr:ribosomal protein S18-alanine N-acetyltransferase [Granulosicoccus sp.]